MANDKSFKIKNGLSATRYLGTNGTETAGSNGPYGTFDTTTYSGTGAARSITNSIDLSTDGGLVWIKDRDVAYGHNLFDTERGAGKFLNSDSTNAEVTDTNRLSAFNTDGFSLGTQAAVNSSGDNYVAWTFKQASNFFDVVTYTGDGTAGRTVSHNLGSVPAFIIVKRTNNTGSWASYHRSIGNTAAIQLNYANAIDTYVGYWNNTSPTSTEFTLGDFAEVNGNGDTFVAYLFAHDTSADSYIKCDSYTGNGSADGPEINLGWEPSWILIKCATYAGQGWYVWDNVRGIASGSDPILQPHLSNAEANVNWLDLTSTGFTITDNGYQTNKSGETYIYMAIRAVVLTQTLDLSTGHTFSITPTDATDVLFSNPPASGVATGFTVEVDNSAGGYAITWPSSIKWHLNTAPTATASKEVYTFITTDGGTTYYGKKAGENLA